MSTELEAEHSAHQVQPRHSTHDDKEHWTEIQYIKLAFGLAIVTALEVLLSYIQDDVGALFLPLMLTMMAIKFFAVVLFFMHLKFDNRLFGMLFYTGLFLAVGVYVAALLTFHFFSP